MAIGDAQPAFDDIISALSNNKIKTRVGHVRWDDKTKAVEIFANLSCLKASAIEIPKFGEPMNDIIRAYEKMFTG